MADDEVLTFPTDIAQFDSDERISFSRLDNKYIAVQDDGTEFEFDEGRRRWTPLADDDDEGPASVDAAALQLPASGAYVADDAPRGAGRKRKPDHDYYQREPQDHLPQQGGPADANANAPAGSRNKRPKAPRGPPKPRPNTAVYVTGLPFDATVDEVAELFSRKCGVIAEEIDSGRPRIKMYTDGAGRFKGDALVVFFKPQSVDMAIMLLDDTDFRFMPAPASSSAPTPPGRMRVQVADASYKKTTYQQSGDAAASGGGGAAGPKPAAEAMPVPAPPAGAAQDKQKIIKKTQKLDAKLADWSSDEDERYYGATGGRGGAASGGPRSAKWDKVVVLKHMFTLAELEEDPAALLDIKEDIREECSKLGDVTNVVLFDREAAGVVSVKFKTAEAATACVKLMNGRAFDGRTVEATLATSRDSYKKSIKGDNDNEDDEAGGFSDDD